MRGSCRRNSNQKCRLLRLGRSRLAVPKETSIAGSFHHRSSRTPELPLKVGQPGVIRQSLRAHGRPVAAAIVGTLDQETANASGTPFSKDDLLLAAKGRHAVINARSEPGVVSSPRLGSEPCGATADRGVPALRRDRDLARADQDQMRAAGFGAANA